MERKFVIATNNQHKVEEFKKILAPLGVTCFSLKEMGIVSDAEETGKTFAENAEIKARAAYDLCRLPCIADDSGISVDALNGEPGIYSARYGNIGDDEGRLAFLLENMKDKENRKAHFTASICCFPDDQTVIRAEGYVYGTLTYAPRGENGFGYDPIFLPEGETRTMAEMQDFEKNAISHRGNALRLFVEKLKEYYDAEQ